MLNVTYSCVTKSSYITLGVNILITIYFGILMPKKGHQEHPNCCKSWNSMLLFKCIDRPRTANEPPFFFQEVRLGMLMLSILYNIARLVYELTVMDISVLLVAARLLLTSLQLLDQWWFCKNWASFFLEKQMRAYIWFRLFIAVSMWSILFTVQTTFSPSYTNLTNDAFLWTSGIQAMIWYFWGKRWNFRWGDMCDERRIPAFVGTLMTTSLLFAGLCVYIRQSQLSSIITALTATIAYFLFGLAFRYLNKVTVVQPPSLPTPVQMSGNKVDMIAKENHHIETVGDSKGNNDDTGRPSVSMDEHTHPTPDPDGSSSTDNLLSLLESGSDINSIDADGGRVRVKPTISPIISPSISRNDIFSQPDDNIKVDHVRIKPHNSLSHSQSTGTIATSLRDASSNNDHSVIGPILTDSNNDHVTVTHIPLMVRQNTFAMNLSSYETSHLLSDKIVVVFVQVTSPPTARSIQPTLSPLHRHHAHPLTPNPRILSPGSLS